MTKRAHISRKLGLVALVTALAACLALASPAVGAKKKGGGNVDVSKAVNLPIPDRTPGAAGQDGILTSTIDVGKQFKGRKIRDVNATVQTVGTTGSTPAQDLVAKLRAPNGAHTSLFINLVGTFNLTTMAFDPNPSIGPLTLDDESPLFLGILEPHDPTQLYVPWAGTARPDGKQLAVMDGGPVQGTWTLTMIDNINTQTSNLASWRLNVVAGRPFKTK